MTSGITLANGKCYGCGQLFWYDPVRVVMVDTAPSARMPMCHYCCRFANPWRAAFGLPLLSEEDTSPGRPVIA